MKKISLYLIATLLLFLLLAGCNGKSAAPAEITPIAAADTIVSEGHFVPRDSLYLSFLVRGKVSEILVKQGEEVQQGQVLIRIGDSQPAQATLAAANLELTAAHQSLDALVRTAALSQAQALLAYKNAQKARIDAQLAWDRLDLKGIQNNIDDAQEVVDDRKADLEEAQLDFDKYKNADVDDYARNNSEDKLETAQTNYDEAVRLLLIQTNRRDIPRANLDFALSSEAEAERAYKNTQEGPDTDKLALAQSRLDNAQAQVEAAQSALDNYALKAPFNGIVAEINVSLNQQIGPETWAVVVIDPGQWYVETIDLTEYEVVDIKVGDTATITVDSLPDLEFSGIVDEIAMAPKVQAGDVIYTVRLQVDEPDPRLKWGMTVEATFPIKE